MWEKEKLLVTGNFSFSRSVFKRLLLPTRKNQDLLGKGLSPVIKVLVFTGLNNRGSFPHRFESFRSGFYFSYAFVENFHVRKMDARPGLATGPFVVCLSLTFEIFVLKLIDLLPNRASSHKKYDY